MNTFNSSNSSTSSTGRTAVPEAREALNRFKYEIASEIGVPLKQGYNGDLTSAQNGSVGGYMVNTILPERHTTYLRMQNWRNRHCVEVRYTYTVVYKN